MDELSINYKPNENLNILDVTNNLSETYINNYFDNFFVDDNLTELTSKKKIWKKTKKTKREKNLVSLDEKRRRNKKAADKYRIKKKKELKNLIEMNELLIKENKELKNKIEQLNQKIFNTKNVLPK